MITSITILAILVGVLVIAVIRSASINYKLIEQIETLKANHEYLDKMTDERFDDYTSLLGEMQQDIENLMEDVANQGIK